MRAFVFIGSLGRFSRDQTATLGLCLASFFWASGFVIGKIALGIIEPVQLTALRFGAAALIMALILKTNGFSIMPPKGERVVVVFASLLGVVLYNIIFFIALSLTSPVHGLCIMAISPAMTTLISFIFTGERASFRKIIGLTVAFLGVVLTVSQSIQPNWYTNSILRKALIGDGLFVLASIIWAFYSITIGKIRVSNSFALTGWTITIGGAAVVVYAVCSINIASNLDLPSYKIIIIILYMAIFGTVVANTLWNFGVKQLGPTRASVFINLVPIWGMLISAVVFAGLPQLENLIGAACAIGGVILVQSSPVLRVPAQARPLRREP